MMAGCISHGGANGSKSEIGGPAHSELTVGGIVIHVALVRMSLAPGAIHAG